VRQLGLARAQHGQARRRVGRDVDDDAVEIRKALHVKRRVALVDDADALLVRLHHEGPGADDRVGMVEVLELVLGFARQDRAEGRVRQVVQEGRVRLLERDAHRIAIDDVDGLHGLEAVAEARLRHESLERVLDVVGRDLAAVDRRLVVEEHTLSKSERVDLAVLRDRPLLGQVGKNREIGRALLLGPVGEANEHAVAEAHVRVGEKADGQVRVEPRRLALGDTDDPAALGLLSKRPVGARQRNRQHE
jgi:hypothetical protein